MLLLLLLTFFCHCPHDDMAPSHTSLQDSSRRLWYSGMLPNSEGFMALKTRNKGIGTSIHILFTTNSINNNLCTNSPFQFCSPHCLAADFYCLKKVMFPGLYERLQLGPFAIGLQFFPQQRHIITGNTFEKPDTKHQCQIFQIFIQFLKQKSDLNFLAFAWLRDKVTLLTHLNSNCLWRTG